MAYNNDDGMDHAKHIKKIGLRLQSGEEMKKMLKDSGYDNISITYYQGLKTR